MATSDPKLHALWDTPDVQLSSYLRLRGHQCEKVTLDDHNRGVMWFAISEEDANRLTLEYCNSEHSPFEGIRRGFLKQIDSLKRQARRKKS